MSNKKPDMSNDLVTKWEWLIADFPLNDSHLEEFYEFLPEFIVKHRLQSAPGSNVGLTIEDVFITPYPMPGLRLKPAALINFVGYIIENGLATKNLEIIIFSVQRPFGEQSLISGTPHPLALNYFLKLIDEIAKRWQESGTAIDQYKIRINLMLQSLKTSSAKEKSTVPQDQSKNLGPTNNTEDNTNNQTTKSRRRKYRPRYDALERVALVLYLHQKKHFSTLIDGVSRYHTSMKAIADHRTNSKVIDLIERMEKDPKLVDRIRQKASTGPKKHAPDIADNDNNDKPR